MAGRARGGGAVGPSGTVCADLGAALYRPHRAGARGGFSGVVPIMSVMGTRNPGRQAEWDGSRSAERSERFRGRTGCGASLSALRGGRGGARGGSWRRASPAPRGGRGVRLPPRVSRAPRRPLFPAARRLGRSGERGRPGPLRRGRWRPGGSALGGHAGGVPGPARPFGALAAPTWRFGGRGWRGRRPWNGRRPRWWVPRGRASGPPSGVSPEPVAGCGGVCGGDESAIAPALFPPLRRRVAQPPVRLSTRGPGSSYRFIRRGGYQMVASVFGRWTAWDHFLYRMVASVFRTGPPDS